MCDGIATLPLHVVKLALLIKVEFVHLLRVSYRGHTFV